MESNELKKIEDELKVYDVAYFKNNKPSELFLDGELFLDSLEEAIRDYGYYGDIEEFSEKAGLKGLAGKGFMEKDYFSGVKEYICISTRDDDDEFVENHEIYFAKLEELMNKWGVGLRITYNNYKAELNYCYSELSFSKTLDLRIVAYRYKDVKNIVNAEAESNESWQEMKFRYEEAAEKLVKEFIKDGYLIEFKIKEEFIKDLKEFWNL